MTGIQATYSSGQTFLTWNEEEGASAYRVYRRVGSPTDGSDEDLLATVKPGSSLNGRASRVQDDTVYFRIPDRQLGSGDGLLVVTAAAEEMAFYGVRSVGEDGAPGELSALERPVRENPEPPGAVSQETVTVEGGLELKRYVHWTNWTDTPDYPAMANRPGLAYNFATHNERPGTRQTLLIRLHGGGGNYTRTNFQTDYENELRILSPISLPRRQPPAADG